MAREGGGAGSGNTPLATGITRRDFVNATLVGAGAALLHAPCPAAAQRPGAEWTGYGGVGDYRQSNGTTARVMDAAHRIRDGRYDAALPAVIDTGERYDVVIVGAGFTGLGALHEFAKRFPRGTCLLLDNQEIFGGYAKANEFDVDGVRIAGAQASMNFILPATATERAEGYWDEFGLPERFPFAERTGGDPAIAFQRSTSGALYHGEQSATVGYFFDGASTCVKDIWSDDLRRAAWSPAISQGLLALRDRKLRGKPDPAEAARLDSMTFAEFATRELGATPEALRYITQGMCITGPQVSALAAQSLPGLERFAAGSPGAEVAGRFMSFPGGNTTLSRCFVKAAIPDAIPGPSAWEAITAAPVDPVAADRAGAPRRLRQGATVVRVQHEGDPRTADHVAIVYEKAGRLHRVRASAVILAIGSWVGKHVIVDLPTDRRAALDRFLYAPFLTINVALRNWRFLDRMGISAARWFEGFGFYCTVRQPMILDSAPVPFHPDKPIVMTFYVPFQHPELPLEMQGPAGRAELYATSYADYERQLVTQMRRLFAAGGFDAHRDIAGLVLDRWGHAFVTPPPGFLRGTAGAPSPLDTARAPFGRIAFGQTGLEDWLGAAHAGKRALGEVAALI